MAVTRFDLVTHWHLDAPIDDVWDALIHVEDWPRWWKAVVGVAAVALEAVHWTRPMSVSAIGRGQPSRAKPWSANRRSIQTGSEEQD